MLGPLLASLVTAETSFAVQRLRRVVVSYAIAAIGLGVGAGFFVAAAYMAAANRWGDIEAALVFGAGFVLLSIVALLVHRIASSAKARRQAARRSADMKTLAGAAAIGLLPVLMRSGRAGLLAPLLAVAGYAIYNENRKRREDEEEEL